MTPPNNSRWGDTLGDAQGDAHRRWEPADLVQHQVVSIIAAHQQRRPRVVFKGGTLLRMCYRRHYRYSEDLDFDWVYEDAPDRPSWTSSTTWRRRRPAATARRSRPGGAPTS